MVTCLLAHSYVHFSTVCLVGLEMTKYNVSEDLATVEVCLVKINNVILASAIIMRVSTGDVVADNDVDSAEGEITYIRRVIDDIDRHKIRSI